MFLVFGGGMSIATLDNTTKIVDKVIPYARKLFIKYGYRKTTVDDIASGLHISKKTLYAVFPSKEEILKETIWRETLQVLHTFNDTIPAGCPTDRMMLSFCRFIFTDRIKKGKNGLFWALYVDDPDIVEAAVEALKRVFSAIYEDGSHKGHFKPIEPYFAALTIVSMILASVNSFHLSQKPIRVFNDTLLMIADAVAYRNRIVFDTMV